MPARVKPPFSRLNPIEGEKMLPNGMLTKTTSVIALKLKGFPSCCDSLHEDREAWIAADVCQMRIVGREQRIIDEAALERTFQPFHRAILVVDQGETLRDHPRILGVAAHHRFEVRCYASARLRRVSM